MDKTGKFRKKPVEIEAIQYTGHNGPDVVRFAEGHVRLWSPDVPGQVYDDLHSTWVNFNDGDWIIRGVKGEFYPCNPDVFDSTYERVD